MEWFQNHRVKFTAQDPRLQVFAIFALPMETLLLRKTPVINWVSSTQAPPVHQGVTTSDSLPSFQTPSSLSTGISTFGSIYRNNVNYTATLIISAARNKIEEWVSLFTLEKRVVIFCFVICHIPWQRAAPDSLPSLPPSSPSTTHALAHWFFFDSSLSIVVFPSLHPSLSCLLHHQDFISKLPLRKGFFRLPKPMTSGSCLWDPRPRSTASASTSGLRSSNWCHPDHPLDFN